MEHSMASIDDQIPLLPQTERDEIEEGKEVGHLIDIKDANEIFDEMFEDLESVKSCTIFKVNVYLRESNPDAYTPKMVSIGPYHKKNPKLPPMKKYKLLYLRRFLQRNEKLDVKSCITKLEEVKERAIECYEDIEDDSQFCQMLLLDGCFVLEFIRERVGMFPEGEDDVINDNIGNYIIRDLLLLENQLPLFVLEQLHYMTMEGDDLLATLAMLVLDSFPFFASLQVMTLDFITETGGSHNIKHLLHLVHIISCHGTGKKISKDILLRRKVMSNATELSEAGVIFKNVNTRSLLDSIKFEKGVMTIPCFKVADYTETHLRNLIAYEQHSVDEQPKYFSDFATFINYLIDSDKDVALLRHEGIIDNWLGEDKEVASIFNKIGNGVDVYSDFYYKEECTKACKHCETRWKKTMANLKRNYFSSPWVGASTMAAIILLVLTAIQTVLAFTSSIK